ncbi:DUF1549 domain-containing protein [Blastopirellula retiformator]|uniref:DUF1549 domain-containing protein n=1 Tax=Blastopirellula retiformator TaxID=2527970 RepID=A0A5C5V8K3_9BACT|nr:DUF1549 domain-containing protein [Blastopirellula retiformator]TWT34177.1 hypothetical protein Enr8_15710 [Blastopirellula retiformator]
MFRAIQMAGLLALLATGAIPAAAAQGGDAEAIAQLIDARLQELWSERGVAPAAPADSATFLRRASLDLLGRIPTAAEARSFVREDSPKLRKATIGRMVENSASSERLAQILRRSWFPQTDVSPYQYLTVDTERWLTRQLQQRTPLNQIAQRMIAVSYVPNETHVGAAAIPRTLIEANDHRAERMAANATGSFLGIDISCAQCHDHPFGSWTQDQFWQTAAFFTRTTTDAATPFSLAMLKIDVPETDRHVSAQLFTGETIAAGDEAPFQSGRDAFAVWVAGNENPFFARHVVNRLWAEYFGAPLVQEYDEEPDDPRLAQLLDELAGQLVQARFDIRALSEGLVLTQAYQLGTATDSTYESGANLFAAAKVRGMTGEQLYDSLCVSAGRPPVREDLDSTVALRRRRDFCEQFRINSAAPERSMTQSLAMMNGVFARQLIDPDENPTLQAMNTVPFLSARERTDALFWATLGRGPTDQERRRLQEAGMGGDDAATRSARNADLYWILINTVEFSTNH